MTTVQFRTDDATKAQAVAIFQQLGITMTDAINMFLRQAILHDGLPFEVKIPKPNQTTLNAMKDAENDINLKKFSNAEDMFKELDI